MKLRSFVLPALTALASVSVAHAADAPIKTKSGEIGTPAAGMGQIVFYRTGSLMGAALGCTVREGQGAEKTEVARLGAGKYFVVQAAPGPRDYYTTGEATDKLHMEVEADETYYVRCNIGMGVVAGRANIAPVDRATFASKAKGLALWKGPKAETAAK